jgi:hypothetical protein
MKRLGRVRALFGFLREQRHIIFDDAFQDRLEEMYRQTGAGDAPHAPALLCMVTLLQGYVGASDAEAVELSVMDRRWQMVLDCMDAEEPPFSQGALQAFRERMIAHDLDRVLLERSVALVREGVATKGEEQQLSKAVRVAIDSRPLAGAGRVVAGLSKPRESEQPGRRPAGLSRCDYFFLSLGAFGTTAVIL